MSRSLSFADAVATAKSPIKSLHVMGGVFAPGDDEADRSRKRARHRELLGKFPRGEQVDGSSATPSAVLDIVASSQVAHVMAHGQRARSGQNPMDAAGLRLAAPNGKIRRTGAAEALLTPGDILRSPSTFPDGHVTLLACVTGIGKRGEGGDTLGFEYALRMRGTASVLASHWHIEWHSAIQFAEVFYDCWLTKKMSRAEAWRHANLAVGARHEDGLGGAFSLYGDWR